MANTILRIGTRESPLAVWQARQVQDLLQNNGVQSELVYIKSEGDNDLVTPLYALGVQGIFTKALDAALLNNRIDIAVHSLKDVPVQMADGIIQAAVLKRGSYKDIFVYKDETDLEKIGFVNGGWLNVKRETSIVRRETSDVNGETSIVKRETSDVNGKTLNVKGQTSNYTDQSFTIHDSRFTVATCSVRRIAQWLNRYPGTVIENLRGNVNTRLNKVYTHNWNGAIFAAAGLERINIRPKNSVDLDWMLPAPAQGAITVVCRRTDKEIYAHCQGFNDEATASCVKIERDFLKALMGGCSTPISALAVVKDNEVVFKGNILSVDGKEKIEIEKMAPLNKSTGLGIIAGDDILSAGADKIIEQIRNAHQ